MNPVWFVTTDAISPEGYYVAAPTAGKARAFGANEIGCDFTTVKVYRVVCPDTDQEGIIPPPVCT